MDIENYMVDDKRHTLFGDVTQSISIEGEHVVFDGQGHEIHGWVHIGPGKTLLLKNFSAIQTTPEDFITIEKDGRCPVCSLIVEEAHEGDKFMIMVHPRSESCTVENIKMLAAETLTSFGEFGKEGPKEFVRCKLNGKPIPDYIKP